MFRAFAAVVTCAVLSACAGSSISPSQFGSPPGQNSIDSIVQANYGGGWGVELAIYKKGTLAYSHGYGFRDRGLPDVFHVGNFWNVTQPDAIFNLPRGAFAPDAGTIYNLASVSKEFTAGAVLLLQQDGKLSVNDPVSKYFPAIPNGNAIPLLYLLQHRSGLVDCMNFGVYPDFGPAYSAFQAGGQIDHTPVVTALASFPLQFAPGSQYQYSNSNYLLLGLIVEQVSGQPLASFLQQRIFGPLGMTHTAQGYPAAPQSDIALGYRDDGAGAVRTWQWNLAYMSGFGGMTSTVQDLEKWDQAIRQPGIFTQASLTQMFTPSPIGTPVGPYADGWFVTTLNGHRYLWHDGAIGGFQTMNAVFPDDGIDIIVLTNDGTGLDPYYIIPQLFASAQTLARSR